MATRADATLVATPTSILVEEQSPAHGTSDGDAGRGVGGAGAHGLSAGRSRREKLRSLVEPVGRSWEDSAGKDAKGRDVAGAVSA